WEASTYYRRHDGTRARVRRYGATRAAALAALDETLRTLPDLLPGGDLSPATPFAEIADAWMRDVDDAVAAGLRAPNTARVYRLMLRRHLVPALGDTPIGTLTVTRLDGYLRSLRAHHQPALVKTARTVLNGECGYATRHGLLPTNPMRDVGRIAGAPPKKVRALTDTERERWLAALDADPKAVREDLPELTRFMLATGCRIGEALAVHWEDIDFDNKTVHIHAGVVRLENGGGLHRGPTKTTAGDRVLYLPGWAVDMLRGRAERMRAS
ncbi:tyrosine-type recombinase/integrase, partial [Salmonella enterica]|uniref:tyrosine-type recombinase/integrase n=1 Tax=Salmonella enterica TaxID=28901 RepID=UPI003297CA17